jgi:hypothetical chaperone protein
MTVIGVDFGTTNTVVTRLLPDGTAHTVRHRFGAAELDVVRTLLCFWNEGAGNQIHLRHGVGPAAVEAYLDDPVDTRLMMSLKSYLAQRSFTETRVFGRNYTLQDLIALFLGAVVPPCAGEAAGAMVVAGRPVRFAGDNPDDAFGEQRLRQSYIASGWNSVHTALEPEAAGYRFARGLNGPATVLIGDFGGGTSDFSVMRFEPGSRQAVHALGHSGIGIAGDSFDYRIMDHVVSPRLGKGSTYRVFGKDLPIPAEYYASFARWHRLSQMRAPRTMRDIETVARTAARPEQLQALLRLVRDESGYELYRVVSGVKAALSAAEAASLRFQHEDFTIDQTITRADFEAWIAPDVARIAATIEAALGQAGLGEREIDRVFLTGGTSLVPAVRRLFTTRFGAERVMGGGEFVSVAEGLALIGRDRG